MERTPSIIQSVAQVDHVITIHDLLTLPQFSDYIIDTDLRNQSLSEIESALKFVTVKKDDTDIPFITETMNDLSTNPNRYKRLSSIPVCMVSVPQNTKTITTHCYPLTNKIISTPQKGDWIMITGISRSMLKMEPLNSKQDYIFFYTPYSFFSKKGQFLKRVNELTEEMGNSATNVLWPREGGITLQNQNGQSYIQLDQNSIMISSGFEDLLADNTEIANNKTQEFQRFNPINAMDSFIFVSKYNKIWEEDLFEYLKKLYELQDVDTDYIDSFVQDLLASRNFVERIKVWFGINISRTPEYEFGQPPQSNDNDETIDSGILISGKTIVFSHPTQESQVKYRAARSDRVIDLLNGVITYLQDHLASFSSHKHLGTPASVLNPTPDVVSDANTLSNQLEELKSKLESISSPNIYLP